MISDFLYIGHRGTRIDFDENTILAFNKAIEFGANYIEFDVRKTKDGNLVVLHDATLDRTTNGKGELQEFTLKKLQYFKTKIQKTRIPSLTTVFDALKGKTRFMIELKEPAILHHVAEIIEDYDLIEECIVSGRILAELLEFKKNYPQIKICYNLSKGKGLAFTKFMKLSRDKALELKIDLISLHSTLISKEFIAKCRNSGISPLSWDFLNYKNPIEKIKELIILGIDGILFDNYKNICKIKKWKNAF